MPWQNGYKRHWQRKAVNLKLFFIMRKTGMPLWPHVFDARAYAHLQSTLDAVQVMSDEKNRSNALKKVFSQLMADATLTPLFNYHYRISAPPGVNGVRLTPRGWFEFTEAWLPAPSQ